MKRILYFVTPEIDDNLEGIIEKAVLGGVNTVQIRDKHCSTETFIAFAKKIQPLLKKHRVPLIINDRIDVALAVQADGAHLGQTDLSVTKARAILGKKAIIGLSVETLDQALSAPQDVTYFAASPVLASKTKSDCGKPWGLDGLKQLCNTTHLPVIAIGGINITNVQAILDCGAAGIAVVSAISKAPCPTTASRELYKVIEKGYTERT
ncbi:MAG: thiamine phosphate synthase [Verrucomicrobia bacterium]|nr:thiamine phosphate synthase [Verrucomicrobiota bacterium]